LKALESEFDEARQDVRNLLESFENGDRRRRSQGISIPERRVYKGIGRIRGLQKWIEVEERELGDVRGETFGSQSSRLVEFGKTILVNNAYFISASVKI
jgi:hypothetical protein